MALHDTIGNSPVFTGPLYAQVAAVLRGKISSKEWTPAEALPNEALLAKTIGVSVGTIRKALEILEDERLIYRRQGRGTFVVDISEDSELERFSNLVIGSKKIKADAARLSASSGVATRDECDRLNLRSGDPVIRFEGVWTAADTIKVAERISVPQARFQGLEKRDINGGQTLYAIYRKHYNIIIGRVAEQVSCVNADDSLAGILGVRRDQALLRMDRVSRAAGGGPVEWCVRHAHMKTASYAVSMS